MQETIAKCKRCKKELKSITQIYTIGTKDFCLKCYGYDDMDISIRTENKKRFSLTGYRGPGDDTCG